MEMDTSGQETFISRIRSALGHPPNERRRANLCGTDVLSEGVDAILDRIKNRTEAERQRLLDKFIEMAEPIKLVVTAFKDSDSAARAIANLVRNKAPEWGNQKTIAAWQHPLIESLNLSEAMADQKVLIYVTDLKDTAADKIPDQRRRIRKQVIDSYIGITSADYCLADTATLVMRTRPGQARSVSLVPSIHIAVIRINQIIADLKELYALLKWDTELQKEGLTNCMTFISGPSKTADVEATMVHGAHGPREVYVYVIAE
jgi:L-lactate dehydrogenase complex protein LldG